MKNYKFCFNQGKERKVKDGGHLELFRQNNGTDE